MLQDLIDGRPLRRVVLKDVLDQVLCRLRDGYCLWEAILTHSDFLIGSLNIVCFEWRLSNDQGVNNDTKRPNVYLV